MAPQATEQPGRILPGNLQHAHGRHSTLRPHGPPHRPHHPGPPRHPRRRRRAHAAAARRRAPQGGLGPDAAAARRRLRRRRRGPARLRRVPAAATAPDRAGAGRVVRRPDGRAGLGARARRRQLHGRAHRDPAGGHGPGADGDRHLAGRHGPGLGDDLGQVGAAPRRALRTLRPAAAAAAAHGPWTPRPAVGDVRPARQPRGRGRHRRGGVTRQRHRLRGDDRRAGPDRHRRDRRRARHDRVGHP